MSRADELRARYEAEAAVLEAEDALAAAKATVDRCTECGRRKSADSPELRDVKLRLREARRAFREQREGAATVQPATIEVTSTVPGPGGDD